MTEIVSSDATECITPIDSFLPDFVCSGPTESDPDDDDPTPLPPAPDGALQLWAHGPAGTEVAFKRVQTNLNPQTVSMARTFAKASAHILSAHPLYAGGKVRIVDGRGNVWHREPIPVRGSAARVAA